MSNFIDTNRASNTIVLPSFSPFLRRFAHAGVLFFLSLLLLLLPFTELSTMPPRHRGRPRKRDTRMDAALDAMRPYGFSPSLVLKTVKELLHVYGGEGWFFIEEASYKVLIETLLEKGEAEAEDKGNTISHDANTSAPEPESEDLPDCNNAHMNNTASQTNEHVSTAARTNQALESASPSHEAHDHASPLPNQAVSEDINLDQNNPKKQTDTSLENKNAASVNIQHPSTALVDDYPLPTDGFPLRKVRPCHGWIDDDDKKLDLVELTPSPLSENLRRMLDRVDGFFRPAQRKKSKSRWDVKPGDVM